MMDIKRELKIVGIKPLEEITVEEKTSIAEKVADKLGNLNIIDLSYNEVLDKLLNSKMYRAQMNSNLGKVSYFYKNKTIYFDKDLFLGKLDEKIMHECIHYLQDQREKTKRIGLCSLEEFKVRGMALNEIGIKYISNQLLNKQDKNKTFTLLTQILLITGEEVFLDSILNSNDKFEEKFMEETNSEILYYKMQNSLDSMFDLEQIIKRLNVEGRKSRSPQRYLSKINMHKHTLNSTFLEIQWEIYHRYFSRKMELIDQIEEIEVYKNEIFNFNQWLEMSEEELKYTNYAIEKFEKLNKIEMQILRKNANNSMVLIGDSKINKIMRNIKKIIFRQKEYETNK